MKLNLMVRIVALAGFFVLLTRPLPAQPLQRLSLKDAYARLEANYPVLQNAALLTEIHEKEQAGLDKARLPAVYLKADGRAQTQSTQLQVEEGFPLPFEINQPLVSAKAYLEAQYVILDGGMTKAQREMKSLQLQADQQDLEVDRFALRERVNQLCLGALLLREQSKLFDISLEDLRVRKESVAAAVENGVALPSELARLEVKELEIRGQQDNLAYKLRGTLETLSHLIGAELAPEVEFVLPALGNAGEIPELDRPEQRLLMVQKASLLAHTQMIDAARRPKLSAYAQAGTGYPNPLNILDNDIAPYGLVGAQFSFQITDWKKSRLDKEIVGLQARKLDHAEEAFEFNMAAREASYIAEVERLQSQLLQDERIARLQADILQQLAAQLDEGVITSAEYVTQVNAELKARQNLLVHQTQLLQTQLDFWNERGGNPSNTK